MERFDENLEEYDIQEGPVYWSKDRKLRIDEVNSSIKPYFKIYKAEVDAFDIYNETTKMCRLSIDDLSYIDGIGSNWILSEEEKKYIIKVLNSPYKGNINITILDYIKESYKSNMKKRENK